MSRAGYNEDIYDTWSLIRWRGAVASSIRGKRGQAFLKEMLAAMESLPQPVLIQDDLERNGQVCAIGTVGRARGLDMSKIDPEDYESVAHLFGVPEALAREIEFINDEGSYRRETNEERFIRVREWVRKQIKDGAL